MGQTGRPCLKTCGTSGHLQVHSQSSASTFRRQMLDNNGAQEMARGSSTRLDGSLEGFDGAHAHPIQHTAIECMSSDNTFIYINKIHTMRNIFLILLVFQNSNIFEVIFKGQGDTHSYLLHWNRTCKACLGRSPI